jgi:hypothetical protein
MGNRERDARGLVRVRWMSALHHAMIAAPIGTEIIPFGAKMASSFGEKG